MVKVKGYSSECLEHSKRDARKRAADLRKRGYGARVVVHARHKGKPIEWDVLKSDRKLKTARKLKADRTGGHKTWGAWIEVHKTQGGYWGVFKTDAKRSIRISPREFLNRKDATAWMNAHKKG
jgi:hypothetical protein